MEIIPRETRKITYSTEIRNLIKRLSLSEYQKAVLIGTILGDGSLEPNWSHTNYKLTVSQNIVQKDYVDWKYNIFKDWVLTEPTFNKINNSFRFRTISHREITGFRNEFYVNGKKVIPENISNYLNNPLVLAVWFMDDGNRVKYKNYLVGYHINSQSFTYEENIILARILNLNFNIKCKIQRNHGYFRLYIGARDRDKFKNIVSEFIIPSMKYKLG